MSKNKDLLYMLSQINKHNKLIISVFTSNKLNINVLENILK